MASIVFKTIRFKNFLSVGNNWMEYDLDQRGASGIIGTNGAGKSLLLDALCFSLYGKSYRGCNKPNLINSINERESVVEIEFTTMNKTYKVIRGQKPNVFEIYQNGALLNQDAKAKDYQLFLENNILKMNFKSFTQIIVLGTSNYTPFMELSAADRRDVIEDLLDIQIFSKMRTVLKDYTSDNNHLIAEFDSKMNLVQSKIQLQKTHIERIKSKKKESTGEKQKELDDAILESNKIHNEIVEMENEVQKYFDKISDAADTMNTISELRGYQDKIESKIEGHVEFEKFCSENTECPTCHQEIDVDAVKGLIEENTEKKKELENGMGMLLDEIKKFQERCDEITRINGEIRKLQALITERNGRSAGISRLVESLERDIQGMLVEGEDDTEYQNNLESFIKDLESIEEDRKDLVAYKSILKGAEVLLKDNGIKSKIILEYLPQMNQLINKYLKALDFFVEFNLDENFKETVKSRFRDEFSYESFSEGQKFRINIAILFAWRDIARLKNSSYTNILVLDEVFDSSLDEEGIEEFTKLLRAVTDDNVHVMVISHRGDSMIHKFDRVYTISMERGYTQMTLS